jgi:acetylornithine deacetylase/succinyl-diaminopimelate desuccinylase-like protein
VQRTVAQVVGGAPITVTPLGEAFNSPPSPLDPELLALVERITGEMWPGTIVIPTMSTGATDSRWLRAAGIPSYGVSGLFLGESRAHGRDERIGVKDLYAGRQFLHRLVKELAAVQ